MQRRMPQLSFEHFQQDFIMRNVLALAAALLLIPVAADARPTYPAQLPNASGFGCGLCHNGGGGTPRNAFGLDVEANLSGGTIDWAAVAVLDSDGDGYTNGEELGDPEGDGTAIGGFLASDPSDAGDTGCGNGVVEVLEVCDGDEGIVTTCEDEGFVSGVVTCAEDCQAIDTIGCSNEPAGEDAGGEETDAGGSDAGGETDTGGEADAGTGEADTGGGTDDAGAGDTGTGGEVDADDERDGGSGGGCSAASATGPGATLLLLVGLLVGAGRRRDDSR